MYQYKGRPSKKGRYNIPHVRWIAENRDDDMVVDTSDVAEEQNKIYSQEISTLVNKQIMAIAEAKNIFNITFESNLPSKDKKDSIVPTKATEATHELLNQVQLAQLDALTQKHKNQTKPALPVAERDLRK